MHALALHTTTAELGLAISNFAGDSRSQVWDLGRAMSTHLHEHLAAFLQPQSWSDLGFLAIARGPGSFTSTRIGMVTARTLAQQLNVPLYAISSLAAIAHHQRTQSNAERIPEAMDIAVQMPAQRSEIFVAIYTAIPTETGALKLTPQFPDVALSHDKWQHILDTWQRPYRLLQIEGNLGASVSSVLALADLDWQAGIRPDWSEALPFYGQNPT